MNFKNTVSFVFLFSGFDENMRPSQNPLERLRQIAQKAEPLLFGTRVEGVQPKSGVEGDFVTTENVDHFAKDFKSEGLLI